MSTIPEAAPAGSLAELIGRLSDDRATLERELGEVDLLVTQAKSESTRHEARRAQAAERLAAMAGREGDPRELAELNAQLLTLTQRAALMESQVDVLEGKRRALARHKDALATYGQAVEAIVSAGGGMDPGGASAGGETTGQVDAASLPPAVARLVLTAQEDLRREIARAMHDGPAQSLTNIVLQAQIVERLVARDPAGAGGEVRQLVSMVQQTLEATKSFIFDVRPMVLDDLGLVPTLRRSARERGRRAGIPVEFDSQGNDRRLSMEIESGLFRILDEALAAYLTQAPSRVSLVVEWGDDVEARISATRADEGTTARPTASAPAGSKGDLPPALAAMIEERNANEREAAEAARRSAIVVLPAPVWREIQARAATLGLTAALLEEGSQLRVSTAPSRTPGEPPDGQAPAE